MANALLEERTEQEFSCMPQSAAETANCSYCGKEIDKHKAWYSSCGIPYCNERCFAMFTED